MLTKRRPGRPSVDDPGTPSSLGQRIRQARQTLGLSLAAVAGDDFSRAFLNQVELGRAHPSTQTLRIIARRLQQPIDYFLEEPGDSSAALELILTEAEMSLHHSDIARAERLVSRMLHRPLPLELRTRAQLILATAYLRQGKPQAAKPVIEEAIDVAERSPWPHLLVDLYDRLGSVYYLLRHAHAAGQWFERAIEHYQSAGLKDPGLKARVLGHRANLHYVAGQPIEAIAAYESAIAAEADRLFSEGAEHLRRIGDHELLPHLVVGMAESALEFKDLERAHDLVQQAIDLATRSSDPLAAVAVHRVAGRIAHARGQREISHRHFDRALEVAASVDNPDLRARVTHDFARALEAEGDSAQAALRFRQAYEAGRGPAPAAGVSSPFGA